MSWKCEQCGFKLKGTEKFCPNCATKTLYRCVECGKEMDHGRFKQCPSCRTERIHTVTKAAEKAAATVLTVGVTTAVGLAKKLKK